jgi:hypothetical protein
MDYDKVTGTTFLERVKDAVFEVDWRGLGDECPVYRTHDGVPSTLLAGDMRRLGEMAEREQYRRPATR